MSRITAKEIARALGKGKETAGSDGSWKTMCPAHRDETPSMSVNEVRGKLLVKCHAGCTQDVVIKALQSMDLWPKAKARTSWKPIIPVPDGVKPPTEISHFTMGKPTRYWSYFDQEGKLIGIICRFDQSNGDKTLLPMSYCMPDDGSNNSWQWKSFTKPRPLYNLHKLKGWDGPVALFEGEKTADKAQQLFGKTHLCMSWPGGSNAVKYVDFGPLRNRDVVLWPDADEPGVKAMEIAAEILLTEGAKKTRMVLMPEGLPKGWDVADDIPENMELDIYALLSGAADFTPSGDKVVSTFNKRFALALVGDKAVVLRETLNPKTGKVELTYLAASAFAQFYSNQFVQVGKVEVPAAKYWLNHEERRSYEGITFQPEYQIPGYYNLWRGFSVEPDPTGDWSIFREHLIENVCQNHEDLFKWVFGWFADIYQRPGHKTGTSLSLRGTQGTGKTIVGQIFGSLIKQHYTLVDDPRYVLGNFNSHLAATLLLHSDEGFWGGDPRYVGKLKSMVTADTQRIEPKGKDSYEIDNFMRLLITTNQDWVVPAGYEERRFAVLDMGEQKQQDRPYFMSMWKQLKSGGFGGLLHDLLNYDLTKVDIGKIPMTTALLEQKEMSMSPTAKFWLTCLMNGEILPGENHGWPDKVISQRFYEVFLEMAQSWGVRHRPHENEFFKDIRRLVPPGWFERVRPTIGGKRLWCLTVPNLTTAREFFDELNDAKYTWPVEEQEPEQQNLDSGQDYEAPF